MHLKEGISHIYFAPYTALRAVGWNVVHMQKWVVIDDSVHIELMVVVDLVGKNY